MADKGLVSKSALTAIADAIRSKTNSAETMLPSEMAALIESISGIPDGINEIEVVTHTLSSIAVRFDVPCSFSERPFGYVAYNNVKANASASYDKQYTSFIAFVDGYQLAGNPTDGASFVAHSVYLEDGTIEIEPSKGDAARGTWTIIIWR